MSSQARRSRYDGSLPSPASSQLKSDLGRLSGVLAGPSTTSSPEGQGLLEKHALRSDPQLHYSPHPSLRSFLQDGSPSPPFHPECAAPSRSSGNAAPARCPPDARGALHQFCGTMSGAQHPWDPSPQDPKLRHVGAEAATPLCPERVSTRPGGRNQTCTVRLAPHSLGTNPAHTFSTSQRGAPALLPSIHPHALKHGSVSFTRTGLSSHSQSPRDAPAPFLTQLSRREAAPARDL